MKHIIYSSPKNIVVSITAMIIFLWVFPSFLEDLTIPKFIVLILFAFYCFAFISVPFTYLAIDNDSVWVKNRLRFLKTEYKFYQIEKITFKAISRVGEHIVIHLKNGKKKGFQFSMPVEELNEFKFFLKEKNVDFV